MENSDVASGGLDGAPFATISSAFFAQRCSEVVKAPWAGWNGRRFWFCAATENLQQHLPGLGRVASLACKPRVPSQSTGHG